MMKNKVFYLFLFLIWSNFGLAQNDCDSNLCVNYAQSGSFVVLEDLTVSEYPADTNYMVSCEMLCEIEASRSIDSDKIIIINNYKILVYKRENYLEAKE